MPPSLPSPPCDPNKIQWQLLPDGDVELKTPEYGDLQAEQDGRCWITETQKTLTRVHPIDPALLKGLSQ